MCDQEAAAIYDDWAGQDGDISSLSQADLDILWELGGGNADGTGILNWRVRLV